MKKKTIGCNEKRNIRRSPKKLLLYLQFELIAYSSLA